MLNIREISDRTTWDSFLAEVSPRTFLQSWEWGMFQESLGESVFRCGVYAGDEIVALTLAIIVKARRGTFLLCPHGPIVRSRFSSSITGQDVTIAGQAINSQQIVALLMSHLKRFAKSKGCIWIRVCPLMIDTPENRFIFSGLGFHIAPTHMHPEHSWMIDLNPSEDELLAAMRKTTRYCIKKAMKDGVHVVRGLHDTDVETFYRVYQETVDRQNFVPFSREYLFKERSAFGEKCVFLFAEHEERVLATACIIFMANMAFYHHGASSRADAKIPAAYLLQWEAMREAKRRGCTFYNFWGIAPENRPRHPWAGLSLFKKGFGGFAEQYVPAQDYALSRMYWLSYVFELLRKKRRGL